jgi:hypothetical protein
MSIGRRFYSPVSKTLFANGRSYSITAGTALDIAYPDSEAIFPDQCQILSLSGATADRPVAGSALIAEATRVGFYDTTLGEPVFVKAGSNPVSWINIAGSSV